MEYILCIQTAWSFMNINSTALIVRVRCSCGSSNEGARGNFIEYRRLQEQMLPTLFTVIPSYQDSCLSCPPPFFLSHYLRIRSFWWLLHLFPCIFSLHFFLILFLYIFMYILIYYLKNKLIQNQTVKKFKIQ